MNQKVQAISLGEHSIPVHHSMTTNDVVKETQSWYYNKHIFPRSIENHCCLGSCFPVASYYFFNRIKTRVNIYRTLPHEGFFITSIEVFIFGFQVPNFIVMEIYNWIRLL